MSKDALTNIVDKFSTRQKQINEQILALISLVISQRTKIRVPLTEKSIKRHKIGVAINYALLDTEGIIEVFCLRNQVNLGLCGRVQVVPKESLLL